MHRRFGASCHRLHDGSDHDDLLQAKGHLTRKAGGRAQVYVPTQPKQKVVRHMVDEFVRRVFDGSARPLLAHLIKDGSLSEKERRALQRIVDECLGAAARTGHRAAMKLLALAPDRPRDAVDLRGSWQACPAMNESE